MNDNRYYTRIIGDVRQNLGLEPTDSSEDERIMKMSHDEILDRVLNWNGIIGYGGDIRRWVENIYDVKLK